VCLEPKASQDPATLEQDFREALLEQDWREAVAKKTDAFRNLIVAQAFSPMSLTNPEADAVAYQGDPLAFGVPDRAK
jgi:hypothetical protein